MTEKKQLVTPIDFRKRYCHYRTVRGLNQLADIWHISPAEVCNKLICDGMATELLKQKEANLLKK